MSIEHLAATATIDEIVYHRLAPLAYRHVEDERRTALRPYVAEATARDLAMRSALLEITALTDTRLLVFKGAATGPVLYGDGALRPREDIDVWVDGWTAAHALADALTDAGYHTVHQLPGTRARHAIALRRRSFELVDIHAMSARRRRIANALPFESVWERRRTFELDGQTLATPGNPDSFLLTAAHLTGHHPGQTAPLVLLEDLRRLAIELTDDDWSELWQRAERHGLLSALRVASHALDAWSPGAMPPDLLAALDVCRDESERFSNTLLAVLDDLELLPVSEVGHYLGELLYPDADYLHRHFGVARPRPRALLAGWRLARGVVARFAAGGHNLEV